MAKVISIVNQKGGTGKSACTANLTYCATSNRLRENL